MPATLILTMVGLLFLLIVLVFIYVWIGRTRKSVSDTVKKPETFESLSAIIKNTSSSAIELHRAAELILENFNAMTPNTAKAYQDLVQTLCVHPHTDSKLILRFEKTLRSINPQYNDEIEHALKRGLAARD